MNYIVIILYAIFIAISYFVMNKVTRKNDDIFSPYSFFLIFSAIEIPYLFEVNFDITNIPEYARMHISNFDFVFMQHIFNNVIFILSTLLSLSIISPKSRLINRAFTFDSDSTLDSRLHLVLFLFGFLFYLLFLNSIGGIVTLVTSLDKKSNLIQGTGYYQALYGVSLFCSVGFLIRSYSNKNITLFKKIYLFSIVFIVFSIFATIGSRKIPILFILFSFVAWNYSVKRVKLLTAQNIILSLLGLFYFSIMPLFRVDGAWEYYLHNPEVLISDGFSNIGGFFGRFSDIDRSLLIYSIFNIDNLWFGSSFKDILYAPIPRGLYPDKPPVDTGVYIYNIAHGYDFEPTTPFHKMLPVGWPVSTITNMYINFWYIGVIMGGVINGFFLSLFYNCLKYTKYSPVIIYLYVSMIFGDFAITNIKIVSFLTKIVFSFLVIRIIYELTRSKITPR